MAAIDKMELERHEFTLGACAARGVPGRAPPLGGLLFRAELHSFYQMQDRKRVLLAGSYTDGEIVWVGASEFVTSAAVEGGGAAAAGATAGARPSSGDSDCEELLQERDGWDVKWGPQAPDR